jgi:hypothetical protein
VGGWLAGCTLGGRRFRYSDLKEAAWSGLLIYGSCMGLRWWNCSPYMAQGQSADRLCVGYFRFVMTTCVEFGVGTCSVR